MTEALLRHRRYPEAVVGSAVVVGLVSAIPVTLLIGLVPLFVQALSDGATLAQALSAMAITDSEDWEMVPLALGGALLIAALISVVAAGVWCFLAARTPGRPWVAQVAAAVVAAAVPPLLLAWDGNWNVAAPAAVAAGLIALVTAPRVGFPRARHHPVAVG